MELVVTPFGSQVTAAARILRIFGQPLATSHARILHRCGEMVYTERRDGRWPPVFPAKCPYCGEQVKP